MKKIKLVYVYFFIISLFVIGNFFDNPVKQTGIYEKIDQYFGVTALIALLFLLCYGLIFFIKNKIKRFAWEVKLYFMLTAIFFSIYIYILMNSGLEIKTLDSLNLISLNEEYFKNLIELCLYKYQIGYVPTYLLWLILNLKYPFSNIFLTLVFSTFLLVFLVIYAPIKNYIRDAYRERKARKKLEREEKQLHEQIKLKEYLEKNETIKKIKFRENKERVLEEKVEVFRKNIQLKKVINLDINEAGDKK
ncbi:MAG: hypothetical protein IJG31_01680 [Fusobacterium sp.]|nr:hypothetical protein [Fusobacterium sp.]